MRGHAARDVDADGGDLGFVYCHRRQVSLDRPHPGHVWGCPNSGEAADPLGRNGEIGTSTNQNFFQPAHIFDRAQSFALAVRRGETAQIENGIADKLSGAVKSDISAAITLEDLNSALRKEFGRGENVIPLRIAAQSDDRRVFEQKQDVADAPFLAQFDQALLKTQAGSVVNRAELEDGNQSDL